MVSGQEGMRRFKLKLRCRDDSKGPVTALCGMNGYLVSSMGQKARTVHSAVDLLLIVEIRYSSARSIWMRG